MTETITIHTTINAPVDKVWEMYTEPNHIIKWNHASDDWHSPWAQNDLKDGGKFLFRMESKDGSKGFDFGGVYTEVEKHEIIAYDIGDGREVVVKFSRNDDKTLVNVEFEAEKQNSIELQRNGWQAILDNFKKYVESA